MRSSASFPFQKNFREKAVAWACLKEHFAYTNPCEQKYPSNPFQEIIAAGAIEVIPFTPGDRFDQLKEHFNLNPDWYFGYLGYDLKNELEDLYSNHPSSTGEPEISFFRPSTIIFIRKDEIEILSSNNPPNEIYKEILATQHKKMELPGIEFHPVFNRENYITKVNKIKNHILEGDMYEMNLCMEFKAEKIPVDPYSVYSSLIEKSPTPFSGFFRSENHYLMCASPERFLKKEGPRLISQPIKGTIRRDPDKKTDDSLKEQLRNDEKERAENMMIVDLVRNDLARSSKFGTVKVEEIFGIYPFRHWHQMISTVSAEIDPEVHFIDAIRNAFPMGSMTGAPKIKVMELIEKYEETKRGMYSSAFGYITPNGDFDFNVVIRSLIYNSESQTLRFEVGSAITYDAIPEKEYDECLLKAEAIFSIFPQN